MKYLYLKPVGFLFLFILAGCGGGSGTPLALTWPSFSEFTALENISASSWEVPATSNKTSSIAYSIVSGSDAASFSVSGSSLSFNVNPNYEAPIDANADGVYEVTLQATSKNITANRVIYVRVTDAAELPVISTSSIPNVAENSAVIVIIAASDEDANSVLSYSLLDSAGAKDEGLLSINSESGALTFKTAPNFESPTDLNADNTISVTVVVSDGALSASADYSFAISDINDVPTIASVNEHNYSEGITSLLTVEASDEDPNSTLTYSLKSGSDLVDEALFGINTASGLVAFLVAPDFENPSDVGLDNIYNFTVNVSDGSLTASKAMTLTVNNVDESPVFSIASAQAYAENSGGTISVVATDPEAAASGITYSLSGNDASKFLISSSGVLSFIAAPNYENASDFGSNNVFDVAVSASDGSLTTSVALIISITDDASDNFGIQLPSNVGIAELQKENE
jgi:VCBS repeat-containing protein|tara:strand:+ start:382 stop:1752 length:1371 start_codon:yes stop_codon:yes gene_type:complete